MKIVICTKQDLEGNIALNKIVREIQGHELFVILSDKFMKVEREVRESADFIFYERDLLVEQIYPLLERTPLSPEENPKYLTFGQIRNRYHIPLRIMGNINAPDAEAWLREIRPDIILSVRYDFIFRKHIIDIPKYGILNVHPGKLPHYRGVYAPFRAMLYGDQHAGCTLHFVDEGIDTGPMVGIRYLPTDHSKSVLWHMANLYPMGIDMFIEHLPELGKGVLPPSKPQNSAEGHYYTFPTPEEFREFADKGGKLIDNREYLDFLAGYHSHPAYRFPEK